MRFLVMLSICFFQLLYTQIGYANFVAWDKSNAEKSEQSWQVKESEHFAITYIESNTAMADKALNIAERTHTELVPFFGQESAEKTQMVLVDDFDFSNGWATFFPFAQIRLFSSPPDSIDGLEVNDDWLHTLIRHEYVHILHMQMARGLPEALRKLFGNIVVAFPHSLTPSFMLEGLATYLETNHELGYGRLQGSYYQMQMRTEVAEQRLKSLGDVAVPLRDLPLGMHYLYGSYFYQFLAQTYSEKNISQYLQKYSGEAIPSVMQNNAMSSIVGKDFDELWQEYHQWLNITFSGEIKSLRSATVQGEALAIEEGELGLFKDVSASQGKNFYFIQQNGEDTAQLTRYEKGEFDATLDATFETIFETMVDVKNILSIDVNDDGEVVASRIITGSDGRSWADVFLLVDGVFGKTWQALTEKSRLRNVRWLNNNKMIASRKINGRSELVILDKQGNIQSLWRGQDETTVLGDFDVSPDNRYLVAAVKRAQQGWNLERIELSISLTSELKSENEESDYSIGQWQALTATKAVENSPQILADGRILFSADYDDIYNIFILNPRTDNVVQITNMLTGAFEPKLISNADTSLEPDSSSEPEIIFQAYTADGFEFRKIALTEKPHVDRFALAEKTGNYNYPKPFTIDVEKTTAEDYSPWSSVRPRWWFPYYSATPEATQLGLTTGGTDTLARHNYAISLGLDWQNQLSDMILQYSYDNRYQLSFQRSHEYISIFDDEKPEYIVEQDRWIFARNHIANALEDQLSLNAAILVEREGTVNRKDLLSAPCIDINFARHKTCEKTLAGLGLRFDNREGYLNSPGFSAGRYIDLVYETNELLSEVSASDYSGGILQGQWQENFDLPGRRSLSFQILAAQSDKHNEPITIGGENRATELSLFGRDDFALRGYSPSIQGGQYMNINRINYSQWLARIDKGWGIWPIGAGDLSADIYVDYGSAWQTGGTAEYLTGVGIDINIEVLAFYNLMMPIRFSIARGLDKELGGNRAGIGISLPY